MTGRLQGQTALVTGGSRGLGSAICRALAAEGAFVVVGVFRHASEAEQVVAELAAAGFEGRASGFDVRDAGAVERAVNQLVTERGGIDVLVNNAGVVNDGLFPLASHEAWRDVIDTDLHGVFHCCRAAVRPMLKRERGAIVNVGSIAALHAAPGQANYAAAKAGVLALTRTLALELGPRGIRANAVLPGLCAAGMGVRLDRRVVDRERARIPLGRLGQAEEVARAVLFLASDESSYVTGQALVVDGGRTL